MKTARGRWWLYWALLPLLTGCSTEEQVEFGEPSRLTGGFASGNATVGGSCVIDGGCSVSWRNQIYGAMLDAPIGGDVPSGACGARGCHDDGAGNLVFPSGDADTAHGNLLAYGLPGAAGYVVPCEPQLSSIFCNLRFEAGVENPYVGPGETFTGGCGSSMPKLDPDIDAEPLNQLQLDLLAEWIQCGAPNN